MDYEKMPSGPYYQKPAAVLPSIQEEPANGLARASMILGIIAFASFFTFTVYPPIILGSLSVILALLSRGRSLKMHSKAKNGIIFSSIAACCDIAIIVFVVFFLFITPDFFENIYGMSYQEMIEGVQNGTLDYDDIYNNVYDNMYNNINDDIYERNSQ